MAPYFIGLSPTTLDVGTLLDGVKNLVRDFGAGVEPTRHDGSPR